MLTRRHIYYGFEFALSILSASASTIDPWICRIPYLLYGIPLSTNSDKQIRLQIYVSDDLIHFSVQSLSSVQLFATPWTATHKTSLSITNFWSLFKLMSIKSVMPSYHFILCYLLLLLPSILPSIRVFSNESVLHIMWPKYWSFNFSISPSNKYSGLISFRIDWLNLLIVPGTLKNLLQHHSSKASILLC